MKSIGRATHKSTVGSLAYRSGVILTDQKTGEVQDYRKKQVAHVELILPEGAPQWAQDLKESISENREKGVQAFSNVMEGAEKRKDSQIYREIEFALPKELTDEQNLEVAREFAKDYIAKRGMPVLINFHIDVDKETGEKKPHIHALMSTRPFEKEGLGLKNVDWNKRDLWRGVRSELSNLINFHLKMYGHESRVDHRSYAERGIDLLPQPKMRSGVFELEKRAGFDGNKNSPSAFFHRFVTRVGQDWQEKKTQNMLKVMVRPETIVDVVSANQSTFVWSDIQEEVSKRVPSQQMAAQVCAQIAESPALVQVGDHRFFEGTAEAKSVPVYTSRKTLERESDLGSLAQRLSIRERHGVVDGALEEHLDSKDTALRAEHGTGLSADQKEALEHLCSASDLSCMVGYAGSGKSTVLGVATKAWEESGYKVYGLAPTGRAADNLKDCGVSTSQTLQKFLKGYEHGRYQYKSNSVLVLDEAGMVPTHQMKEFLGAVNRLGVKAVVVGDGNQLQPIEAGAAFRSVLGSVDPVSLETIVRQKVEWQRDATQKFGQGKTLEALKMYEDRGHIRLRDGLPSLKELEQALAPQNVEGRAQAEIDLYRLRDTARSLKGVAFGQMLNDVERFTGKRDWRLVFEHKDFESRYKVWKDLESSSRQVLTGHGFDSQAETKEILKKHGQEGQPHLFDVRAGARSEIIGLYKGFYKDQGGEPNSDTKTLLLSLSRRDVELLNQEVRGFLKEEGVVGAQEFTHTVTRPYTDPLKGPNTEISKRSFAKGDVVIFLKNDKGLGVSNGNRGRVVGVDKQRLQVELFGDEKKTVSFAPNLYSAVDHGWATTIYKSQGSDEDKSLYLPSPSDTPNLVYVGATRHREDFQMIGSKEEFGTTESLVSQLSKASEKTLAQDYLQGREPDLKPKESLFRAVSKGFEGLKDFGLSTWSEAKALKDPYSSTSLQTRDPQEVAVDLCSKVLEYWQVRSTEQKETFETDLLDLRSKVEQHNPRALQLFKQAYPDQQKTLWRLQDRVEKETVLENSGTQTTVSPVSEKLYEGRELLRGGTLLGARDGIENVFATPGSQKQSVMARCFKDTPAIRRFTQALSGDLSVEMAPDSEGKWGPVIKGHGRNGEGEITGMRQVLSLSTGESPTFGPSTNAIHVQKGCSSDLTFVTQSLSGALALQNSGVPGKIVVSPDLSFQNKTEEKRFEFDAKACDTLWRAFNTPGSKDVYSVLGEHLPERLSLQEGASSKGQTFIVPTLESGVSLLNAGVEGQIVVDRSRDPILQNVFTSPTGEHVLSSQFSSKVSDTLNAKGIEGLRTLFGSEKIDLQLSKNTNPTPYHERHLRDLGLPSDLGPAARFSSEKGHGLTVDFTARDSKGVECGVVTTFLEGGKSRYLGKSVGATVLLQEAKSSPESVDQVFVTKSLDRGLDLVRVGVEGKVILDLDPSSAAPHLDYEGRVFEVDRGSFFEGLKDALDHQGVSQGRLLLKESTPDLKFGAENTEINSAHQSLLGRIAFAQKTFERSQDLEETSQDFLVEKGLSADPSPEIRSVRSKDPTTGQVDQALVMFARDPEGRVTGQQKLFLTSGETVTSGVLQGSFVSLQQAESASSPSFVVATFESGLALQKTGVDANIVVGFRESNFKHFVPQSFGPAVMCSESSEQKSRVEMAASALEEKKVNVLETSSGLAEVLRQEGVESLQEKIREIHPSVSFNAPVQESTLEGSVSEEASLEKESQAENRETIPERNVVSKGTPSEERDLEVLPLEPEGDSLDAEKAETSVKEDPSVSLKPEISVDDKISAAQKTYSWSKPLGDEGRSALEHKGVTVDPGPDVRLTKARMKDAEQLVPALTCFARNAQGEITGGVKTLLHPETREVLDGEGSQRFFGVMKGSFVNLQGDDKETGRTFLTQSLESGLSLKQAGIEGKIVCTLGEHNLKNYPPTSKEKTLVVCVDHEGRDSKSFKILKEVTATHQKEGLNVFGVYPQQPRDTLNGLLQREGSEGVVNLLTSSGVSCDRQDWTQILKQSIQTTQEKAEVQEFRTKVLESVGVDTYRSWFKDLEIEKRASSLVLQGESAFKTETLSAKYGDQIDQVCSELDLTPKFETESLLQEIESDVEKIDHKAEESIFKEAEKDVSSGFEYVQHSASPEQKEEALLEKTPQAVEQKTLDPRDWYAELKGMGNYQFGKVVRSLLDKYQDPSFENSAKDQILDLMEMAATERGHYSKVISIDSHDAPLANQLESVGVDFRDLAKLHKSTEFTLSERAQKDLFEQGAQKSPWLLKTTLEESWRCLEKNTGSTFEKTEQMKAAQEVCVLLEGSQSRSDSKEVVATFKERYPKAFDRLEELGRTQEPLRENVNRALGKEDGIGLEQDRGFYRVR